MLINFKVMTENSGKKEKIKRIMEVKTKLEDAVRKCVELEIARSKRNRDSDSDSGNINTACRLNHQFSVMSSKKVDRFVVLGSQV